MAVEPLTLIDFIVSICRGLAPPIVVCRMSFGNPSYESNS